MKRIAQTLCVALLIAGLPVSSWATGEKMTAAEDAAYAALEAASPEAAAFEGGDSVVGIILVIAVVALIVWLILDHEKQHAMSSPLEGGDAPAPPAAFR
jgi:hypothetical protein